MLEQPSNVKVQDSFGEHLVACITHARETRNILPTSPLKWCFQTRTLVVDLCESLPFYNSSWGNFVDIQNHKP
jgi:hypothetical protein